VEKKKKKKKKKKNGIPDGDEWECIARPDCILFIG
jgi:hypothetical protein